MTMAEHANGAAPSHAARLHAADTLPPLPGLRDALASLGGTFVEIGAGYGVRLRSLIDAGFLRSFSRIAITDLEPQRMAYAKELVPEAEAIVGDAARLPFADGAVDFVFSDQVIEHVDDDAVMAAEIARVLRPGGRAYVGSVWKKPWGWYFYRNGGHWRLEPTHVREYTSLDAYSNVFSRAGLQVARVHAMPMLFPVGEALLRMMVRARIVAAGRFYDVHSRSRVLRALSRARVPIPGYYGCWVEAHKTA
jgi:SAM-dependent methyltransferase